MSPVSYIPGFSDFFPELAKGDREDRGELLFTADVRNFLPLVPALSFAVFPRYRDHLRGLGQEELL